ncbi:MAG: hypothetical protein ACRDQT_04255 [Gaiellaceae bacterium]
MRALLLLVTSLFALALAVPFPAAGHLTTEPAFLAARSVQRLVLTVHNDREATMTGFRLTVPDGLRILSAGGDEGWSEAVEAVSATWTGGSLAPLEPVVFEVRVEAGAVEPGPAELLGDQLYADGETITWPVALTVVPPGDTPNGDSAVGGTAIAILAVLGTLVIATFGLVVWQRRRPPHQEA